jgi:hypothetical protein
VSRRYTRLTNAHSKKSERLDGNKRRA